MRKSCEYEQCHENLFDYLRHKRKVDPVVVEAVREELGGDVLAKTGDLRIRVNQRLGREDLTSANIRVALEQIPCPVIRQKVLQETAAGSFHPKEEVVLAELFAVFEQGDVRSNKGAVGSCFSPTQPARSGELALVKTDDAPARSSSESCATGEAIRAVSLAECGGSEKLLRYAQLVSAAGIKAIREEPDDAVIEKIQADCVSKLLTPRLALSEIPESVVQMVMVQMVKAMTMYCAGASFSQIGRWFGGKAKSTMYTWIIGLAFALWPVIRGWLWSHVRGARLSIDGEMVEHPQKMVLRVCIRGSG